MRILSLKCPECNANLSIEGERKQCFCQYCGTKIIIDDGATIHTYRTVDEARIREAEMRENIRLRELMLEEKKMEAKEKAKKQKIKLSIALSIIGLLCTAIGIAGESESIGVAGMAALCILVYMWLLPMLTKNP